MPPEDAQPHETGPEPVEGAARTVREVAVLPDGRRITWYSTAVPQEPAP